MTLGFKRQFILGNGVLDIDWKETIVNDKLHLYTEDNLEVHQLKSKHKELTLIGYLIDPYNPNASNKECLESIFHKVNSIDDLFEQLYIYTGRYVLLSVINQKVTVVNDPCGLRQVFLYFVARRFMVGFST